MKIVYNSMHPLTLSLTVLAIVIHPSWSLDINITDKSLRSSLNNTYPLTSKFSSIFEDVDHRISDLIAQNVLDFGHNLGLELAALDTQANKSEIFSPLSIMAALSLLTLGSKGRSYQELKQLLGLDSDSDLIQNPSKYHEVFGVMLNDVQHSNVKSNGTPKRTNANWRFTTPKFSTIHSSSRTKQRVEHIIKVANGLFVRNGFTLNTDYRQVVQSIYKSELQELDFQNKNLEARDVINAWVNKATFGIIPKIINSGIEKSTNIILASALYFKAFWESPFFPHIVERNFYPDGLHNPGIKVQMLQNAAIFPHYDAKEHDCVIVGLPYKGNETTMYLIQPNNSTRQRLRELQKALNAQKINAMIDNMERKTAIVIFPKMHFTRSMSIKKILQTMNIHDIFINGYSDLSLIGNRAETNYRAPPSNPTPTQFSPPRHTVSFDSIDRKIPHYQNPPLYDRDDAPVFIFNSRFGEIEEVSYKTITAKLNRTFETSTMPITTDKPVSTTLSSKHLTERKKRQVPILYKDPSTTALSNLEANRMKLDSYRADLFVDDILHKVDFSVDDKGTEAGATTTVSLTRSGTDFVFRGDTPFIIVIRHDPTKLPLFYAIINKPEL